MYFSIIHEGCFPKGLQNFRFTVLFFQDFKNVIFHCFLASMVCDEKFAAIWIVDSLHVIWHFSLAVFKMFFFVVVSVCNYDVSRHGFLCIILFGLCWPESVGLCLPKCEKFSVIICWSFIFFLLLHNLYYLLLVL